MIDTHWCRTPRAALTREDIGANLWVRPYEILCARQTCSLICDILGTDAPYAAL